MPRECEMVFNIIQTIIKKKQKNKKKTSQKMTLLDIHPMTGIYIDIPQANMEEPTKQVRDGMFSSNGGI